MASDGVGAQRPAHAPADVQRTPEHPWREVKTRAGREVAAPLPRAEEVTPSAFCNEVAVFSDGHVVNPIPGELVPLVEAGKPAVVGKVEGILRHYASPAADRGRIINRFGINVLRTQADPLGHALADSRGGSMQDRIALGRFVDKRLVSCDQQGAF